MPNLIQARRVLMRSTAAAASSTWSPTDLGSALVAGYTTLRAGTVHTSGGNITTWDDFSGNSRTLTSAVGNEPAYSATGFNGSQPGITFDPTNNERMVSGTDAIDLGTGAASAFFMSIILRNTTESYGRILGFVFASGDDIGTPSFSIVRDDTNDVFELYSNGPVCTFSATYDTPIRLALVADGANARFYINNAAQSSDRKSVV